MFTYVHNLVANKKAPEGAFLVALEKPCSD
jgi:hypothetical protein